ncbi:hypothetical protein [Halorubrum sp. DTA46]|uniref:hypothetical protein n=1 Tax=Halorubrum sp. DTA46 TaxID=3402162 RepID=UPI003AAB5ED7
MSSSIHDTDAFGIDDAVLPTDEDANTTPLTDADADRTRVHAGGPSDRHEAGRRWWWR